MKNMKKIISCIMLCAMLATFAPIGVFATETAFEADTSWYTDGASADYTLVDAADLAGFDTLMSSTEKVVFTGTVSLVAGADYDLSGYTWFGQGKFTGTFNGNGATVKNLSTSGYGMFKQASGTLKNFTVDGLTVSGTSDNVGGIVGDKVGALTVIGIHVKNCNVTGGSQVGGILGRTNAGSGLTVTGCSVSGSISGAANVGGTVGYISTNESKAELSNCTNFASITASGSGVGGIIGTVKKTATVSSCNNVGDITSSAANVGGIVGNITLSKNTDLFTVENCSNTGDLSVSLAKNVYAGGIVGYSEKVKLDIDACVVCADISQTVQKDTRERIGGLVGGVNNVTLEVDDCFVNVDVALYAHDPAQSGGFIGFLNSTTATASNIIVCVKGDVKAALTGYVNSNVTCTLSNVYYNSSLYTGDAVSATSYIADSSAYGGITTEAVKAKNFKEAYTSFTNWTVREEMYPYPTAIITENTCVYGVQDTSELGNDVIDYRFVASIDLGDKTLDDYASVGFCITLTYNGVKQTQQVTKDVVYGAVIGGGLTYTAENAGGDYLFVATFGLPKEAEFEATVTPFTVDTDGVISYGISLSCQRTAAGTVVS